MNELIKHECGIDLQSDRYKYVGLSDIPGFDSRGYSVNFDLLQHGIVNRAKEALKAYPKARAILLEQTNTSCFSNSIRKATGLPVFDAITNCDYFMMSYQSNERFGLQEW